MLPGYWCRAGPEDKQPYGTEGPCCQSHPAQRHGPVSLLYPFMRFQTYCALLSSEGINIPFNYVCCSQAEVQCYLVEGDPGSAQLCHAL